MKEQTIFVAEDGSRFDNQQDYIKWEKISGNLGLINEYFRDGIIPEGRLQPLKDLMDPYLKKNGRMEFGDFYDYLLGRDPEPKVRIKHLEILMKTMNFIFYGSCDPCVGD